MKDEREKYNVNTNWNEEPSAVDEEQKSISSERSFFPNTAFFLQKYRVLIFF